eukprot:10477480-Lingulodinium_polyedra.AAC.1
MDPGPAGRGGPRVSGPLWFTGIASGEDGGHGCEVVGIFGSGNVPPLTSRRGRGRLEGRRHGPRSSD